MNEAKKTLESVIQRIIDGATDEEKEALRRWAQSLLEIRHSGLSLQDKMAAAIRTVSEARVLAPRLKKASVELKRIGWDERSWTSRLTIGAMSATILAIGNAGIGFAAFGGAIGLPLWVVFGAGGTFAGLLVEKIALEKELERVTQSSGNAGENHDS